MYSFIHSLKLTQLQLSSVIQEARILVGKAFQKTESILDANLDKVHAVSWLRYFVITLDINIGESR